MAKIGLKCPVAAQITGYDSATGAPTYGNGFIIGKAVTAEKTIESNSVGYKTDYLMSSLDLQMMKSENCVTDTIWTLKRQGHGTMDISSCPIANME